MYGLLVANLKNKLITKAEDLQEKLNAAANVQAEAASRVDALISRIQSALPMPEEQQNG